ncbi:hypothetical protein AGABI2DRAFT_212153, partial [Agaricus bisporus var. bisporus H97]|uniref:hypothetical protein n=1 Tax=Agaricus bisporus var. bisporus (strain H97 / ATCC MYA-4626 / FGSC 10389) TaxID=936046 RepID=UPI00029F6D99
MTRTSAICVPLLQSQSNASHHLFEGVRVEENIGGNAPKKIKSLAAAVFWHFVDAKGSSYGVETGRKLRFTEINISGDHQSFSTEARDTQLIENHKGRDDLTVETVFEVVVDRDMCNIHGTLHGSCAAYFVDPCSSSSLVTLGLLLGIDGTGVSQSMNLIWHRPIYMGTKINIRSTSVFLTGRIRTARCEIWAGNSLCIS